MRLPWAARFLPLLETGAAALSSSSHKSLIVIPNGAKRNEESDALCMVSCYW